MRLFSYLKNISLLAEFMGLAIGFAMVGKGRDYKRTIAPLLILFVLLVIVFGSYISPSAIAYPRDIEVAFWYALPLSYWLSLVSFLGIVVIFFIITMFLFIPIGQAMGEEINIHRPIVAYIVNIIASLIGIWLFVLSSFFQTQPVVWFGVAIVANALYTYSRTGISHLEIGPYSTCILVLLWLGTNVIWSPYQRLQLSEITYTTDDGSSDSVGYNLDV